MRQTKPNATMEGNLPFRDLLDAEERLVVFIENILRVLATGNGGWLFPQQKYSPGACVMD